MKIVFDGTESHTSQGELGDEIKPRSNLRDVGVSREMIQTRGSSIDQIWAQDHTSSHVKADLDDQSDLIQPVTMTETSTSEESHSTTTTTTPDMGSHSLDESQLASFKRSKKIVSHKPSKKFVAFSKPRAVTKAAKPRFVYASAPKSEPKKQVSYDDVKPVPAKTPARPVTRTYTNRSIPVATANSLSTRVRGNDQSEFTYNFAFETTVTMGRAYQLETPGDRNFAIKNEIFAGANHSSGWGVKLSADYVTTSNDDSKKDIKEIGDPSIIVSHPSIYKTNDLDVYGRVRYYAPVAASSRAVGLNHFAYYLLADLKLPEEMIVSNALITRYFAQSAYADSDAFSLVYDSTELTKKVNWLRFGLGQQTQIESHQAIAPGTTAEIYPFLDFIGLPNALIEAKIYLPVYAKGLVGGGPVAASVSNIQAEFFMKLGF